MHYKNKRPAKIGDKVLYPKYSGYGADGKSIVVPAVGTIVSVTSGSESSNATVVPADAITQCTTLGHCLHVEDATHLVSSEDQEAVKAAPEPNGGS